jgi:hypothetical protein
MRKLHLTPLVLAFLLAGCYRKDETDAESSSSSSGTSSGTDGGDADETYVDLPTVDSGSGEGSLGPDD